MKKFKKPWSTAESPRFIRSASLFQGNNYSEPPLFKRANKKNPPTHSLHPWLQAQPSWTDTGPHQRCYHTLQKTLARIVTLHVNIIFIRLMTKMTIRGQRDSSLSSALQHHTVPRATQTVTHPYPSTELPRSC